MLPGFFLCKKVSGRTQQILATLPKNQNPPPNRKFEAAIPSKMLYIKVQMCYHNTQTREPPRAALEKGGFPTWVYWRTHGTSSARTPPRAACWRSFCCTPAFTFWSITASRTGCMSAGTFFWRDGSASAAGIRPASRSTPVPGSAGACSSTTAWASSSARRLRSVTTAPSTTASRWAAPARTPASATPRWATTC